MIKVAFITRSTFYEVHGGNGVQVTETAKSLRELGVDVKIILTHEKINYNEFDLLHFFDLVRPANIIHHINRSGKPFVITPTLVDYSEYDKKHRKGITGFFFGLFPASANEYFKTIARWITGKDSLPAKSYLWKGHKRSVREVLQKSSFLLPNSPSEYKKIKNQYRIDKDFEIIYNGVNTDIFSGAATGEKQKDLVICAARIEGLKNQLNLIKALANKPYRLMLIGEASPNQPGYYQKCKKLASSNIRFMGKISQEELAGFYREAKVHILPSWFETCGLSSLEAAAMGCSVVITDKGFTRDYFGDHAFYCDPSDPDSIYMAILNASNAPPDNKLKALVLNNYTWKNAAMKTMAVYKQVLKIR